MAIFFWLKILKKTNTHKIREQLHTQSHKNKHIKSIKLNILKSYLWQKKKRGIRLTNTEQTLIHSNTSKDKRHINTYNDRFQNKNALKAKMLIKDRRVEVVGQGTLQQVRYLGGQRGGDGAEAPTLHPELPGVEAAASMIHWVAPCTLQRQVKDPANEYPV